MEHIKGAGQQSQLLKALGVRYQLFLDAVTPHALPRWLGFAFLICAYIARVAYLDGFFIVTYALGIYLLNLFIGFLSPKIDPEFAAMQEDEDDGQGSLLPSQKDDEFRPFIRRLPEFKFWHSACRAVLASFAATFFSFFDIPVFWPILLIYFIALFVATMRKQIRHMIKFKYIPFSFGKPKYKGAGGGE